MKNFKPGQKVVIRWLGHPKLAPIIGIYPPDNSILTIVKPSWQHAGYWLLAEYKYDKNGNEQVFPDKVLFPLVDDSVLEKELESIAELV